MYIAQPMKKAKMLFSSMSRTTMPLIGASTPSISSTAPKPSSANRVNPMQSSGGTRALWISKRSRKPPRN